MKVKNDQEKSNLFIQDINSNDKTFRYKIYRYFYSLFQEKKEFQLFLKFIQFFIETMQFISYSFTSVHLNSWKMKDNIYLVFAYSNAFRLSILMRFISYKIFTLFHIVLLSLFLFYV